MVNCHEWCDPEYCWVNQLDDKQLGLTTCHMKQKCNGDQLFDSDFDSGSSHSLWSTRDTDVQDDGGGNDNNVDWHPPVDCVDSDSDYE